MMYGVKTTIGNEEEIYWLHESKYITRLIVSITTYKTMEKLKKHESWNIVEDTNMKFKAIGRLTGLQFSTEIIGV